MENIYPNLKAEMLKRNISPAELAEKIGISEYEMTRRLNGEANFKLSDGVRICHVLGKLDARKLFLRYYTKTQLS